MKPLRAAVGALLILSGCATAGGDAAGPVVEKLAQARSTVESYGALLRARHDHDSAEYLGGEELYIAARASFDAWIERIILCVRMRQSASQCDFHHSELKAVESGETFVTYVRGLDEAQAKVVPILLAPLILDAASLVMDRVASAAEADRLKLIDTLEGMKLKALSEL